MGLGDVMLEAGLFLSSPSYKSPCLSTHSTRVCVCVYTLLIFLEAEEIGATSWSTCVSGIVSYGVGERQGGEEELEYREVNESKDNVYK